LQIGAWNDGRIYLRDRTGELAHSLDGRFAADRPVPQGARGTGYVRNGRHLWLTAHAAYVGVDRTRAERWPRAVGPVGCA